MCLCISCLCVCLYMCVVYAQLEKSNQKQNEAKKENIKPQTQFVCCFRCISIMSDQKKKKTV